MKHFSVSHLPDHVLLRDLRALVSQDCATTAALLAHLGEVDARRLYAHSRYDSMFAWCVGELHLSEDAAAKRIHAARAARKFPALLHAVADGRLHLTAVGLLAPCLTAGNADELIAVATHRSKEQILHELAARFPRPDLPTVIRPLAPVMAPMPSSPLSPPPARELMTVSGPQHALEHVTGEPGRGHQSSPAPVSPPMSPPPHARIAPLSSTSYALQMTLDQETHDLLREAQDLLSHAIPGRAAPEVLKRVLRDWVQAMRCRKFGVTTRPKAQQKAPKGRTIPAAMKRKVWERDGGRCAFRDANGERCGSRTRLQFDHVPPLARGGRTSVDKLQLRCHAHNQLEAERVFGAGFMREKREAGARKPRPSPTASAPS